MLKKGKISQNFSTKKKKQNELEKKTRKEKTKPEKNKVKTNWYWTLRFVEKILSSLDFFYSYICAFIGQSTKYFLVIQGALLLRGQLSLPQLTRRDTRAPRMTT